MSDWWIREIQELEYIECLRTDIEKEIVECEVNDEKIEIMRVSIELKLIEDAEQLDYDLERCKLSPRSLRLKRLEFYEQKNDTFYNKYSHTDGLCSETCTKICTGTCTEKSGPKTVLTTKQCTSITKKGRRCLKRSIMGMDVCHFHKK